MARATHAAAEAMGLKVFAKDPVDSVTAMVVPEGVDEAALRKTMRGTHGFQIAGGQGHLKGKIIRFSHMGYLDSFDILGAIAALELTLIGQGYKLEPGTGLAAAQTVFAQAATK
jgi:aspartate aminotransferase-like enzyme